MTSRISENDNPLTAISKMGAGNAGAMTVMEQILKSNPAALLWLDQMEIYGSGIWLLYKTACKSSIYHTILVLRAAKAGLIAPDIIHLAAEGCIIFTEQQLRQLNHLLDSLPPPRMY